MTDTALQSVAPSPPPAPTSLFELPPQQKIAMASEIATALKDIIVRQRLWVRIGPAEHVKAEGWATLGSLLGIVPRERSVIEHADGTFEAYVELYAMATDRVVGGASAICGADETRWGKADRFARRSMAITRATGKAYRLGFSWIVSLAGYSPTPAEEMPDYSPGDVIETTSRPTSPLKSQQDNAAKIYRGTKEQQEAVLKILKSKRVPESQWEAIHEALKDRPVTALDEAIASVQAFGTG